MKEEKNEAAVQKTLELTLGILTKNDVEYRLLGSVVNAAMIGKQHRRLGDIDLIIERDKNQLVLKELKKNGYSQAPGLFAFGRKYLALETLIHPNLVSVGYFYGTWLRDDRFKMGGRLFNIIIDSYAVQKHSYTLGNYTFSGLPPEIIANGILSSAQNPKREKELIMLKEKKIKAAPNNYIHIHALGISCNWLYYISMWLLNILGNIRVKRGLPFDPWRSQIH